MRVETSSALPTCHHQCVSFQKSTAVAGVKTVGESRTKTEHDRQEHEEH